MAKTIRRSHRFFLFEQDMILRCIDQSRAIALFYSVTMVRIYTSYKDIGQIAVAVSQQQEGKKKITSVVFWWNESAFTPSFSRNIKT